MKTVRQIETAELMLTMNNYSVNYARSLLAATADDLLRHPDKPKAVRGVSSQQMALMARESANLQQELKLVEKTYGTDHLDLVLARGYISNLMGNARVSRYVNQKYADYADELRKVADAVTITT